MDLSVAQIQQLEIKQIYHLLQPTIEKIYQLFKYINIL